MFHIRFRYLYPCIRQKTKKSGIRTDSNGTYFFFTMTMPIEFQFQHMSRAGPLHKYYIFICSLVDEGAENINTFQ